MSAWEKKPAIEGKHGGCLTCGPRPSFFPMDGVIAVGFGSALLLKDGVPVWQAGGRNFGDCMTGAQAEELALKAPDHDWQICLESPLSGRTYQRHGPGEWALIEQNAGFA